MVEEKTESQEVTSPESLNPMGSQDLDPCLCDSGATGLPLSTFASVDRTQSRDLETSSRTSAAQGLGSYLYHEISSYVLSVTGVMTLLKISRNYVPFSQYNVYICSFAQTLRAVFPLYLFI